MESQKIKEDRRKKFLEKMNKLNKKEKNINKLSNQNNQINPQAKTENLTNKPTFFSNTINTSIENYRNINLDNNINNILNNNNQIKRKNEENVGIDFNNIIEQTNKYDYMINFQNIIKRILMIILSIIHCFNYPPLDNAFVFKYTFIILELSSFFFNKYYYSKKVDLRKKLNKSNNNIQQQNQMEKMIENLLNNFGFFNQIFVLYKAIKDFFTDISILFIINIIYLIAMAKDE